MVRTGRWTYLGAVARYVRAASIFYTIPGFGPNLAKRRHEMLHVETLEQLEPPCMKRGQRRLPASVHAGSRSCALRWATCWPTSAPCARAADEPSLDILLNLDREYRQKADADQLRKIAPKRFNPGGEAWLPILHTRRNNWHFTALFSNTARAHELGKERDWVILYFHSDSGGEAQRTIVTETRGPLNGTACCPRPRKRMLPYEGVEK